MTPQPDIIFFLDSDAKIIYKRKQELPIEEINRQLIGYRTLASLTKSFVQLDAQKSPEDLANEALYHLIKKYFHKVVET